MSTLLEGKLKKCIDLLDVDGKNTKLEVQNILFDVLSKLKEGEKDE